jgi:hypothetical protein
VSEEQQGDPRLLAVVYDDMAAKFSTQGLNLPAVQAMRQYFKGLEGEGGWGGSVGILRGGIAMRQYFRGLQVEGGWVMGGHCGWPGLLIAA